MMLQERICHFPNQSQKAFSMKLHNRNELPSWLYHRHAVKGLIERSPQIPRWLILS